MTLKVNYGYFSSVGGIAGNLDIDAIGTHGRFSSDREDERKKTGMDAVFSAIEKSETYRRLLTQYEAKDAPTRYLQYLLSPRELWARAYSQYIVAESKNERLINAGACMVAERNGRQEIVSDCPDFVSKHDTCKKCGGQGWYFVDDWVGTLQGRKDCDCTNNKQ